MKAKELGQCRNKETMEQIKESEIDPTVNEVLMYDRDDFPNLWGKVKSFSKFAWKIDY